MRVESWLHANRNTAIATSGMPSKRHSSCSGCLELSPRHRRMMGLMNPKPIVVNSLYALSSHNGSCAFALLGGAGGASGATLGAGSDGGSCLMAKVDVDI